MSRLPSSLDPLGVQNCYIAGGAVLSAATKTDIADYDYYPKNKDGLMHVLDAAMEDGYITNISDRAITLKYNGVTDLDGNRAIIQVMTYAFFESPEQIFENFDFTVCMGAYDCDTGEYTLHDDFYPDIASKTLRFNPGTLYPLNSLIRINKYRQKGYYISKPETVKVALAVAAIGLPENWDDLESQIGGSYGKEVKIMSKEMDFTLETVYDVLSDITLGFVQEEDEVLGGVKFEEAAAYFENEGVFYHRVPQTMFAASREAYVALTDCGVVDITNMVASAGIPSNLVNTVQGYIPVIDGNHATKRYPYGKFEKSDVLMTEPLDEYRVEFKTKKGDCEYVKFEFDVSDIKELNVYAGMIVVNKGRVL